MQGGPLCLDIPGVEEGISGNKFHLGEGVLFLH